MTDSSPTDEPDVPMVAYKGGAVTVIAGPEPAAFLEWERNREASTTEPFGEYLGRHPECRELRLLLQGDHDLGVDDLVSALQRVNRLALEFDLALGNRLYVTHVGAGEYRAVFVPRDAPETGLQGPRSVGPRVLEFYNDLAPVRAADVTETPLEPMYEETDTDGQIDRATAVGVDAP